MQQFVRKFERRLSLMQEMVADGHDFAAASY
jgi:hypothetical protein